jgi:hypothetical protein
MVLSDIVALRIVALVGVPAVLETVLVSSAATAVCGQGVWPTGIFILPKYWLTAVW